MALKESMDILIKDMKIQDACIEADRQTYAGLLGNVQKHTEELKKRKEEKERFEQFLSRIGGERDFFKDSVQIQALENLALAQEREIADNNNLIEEHQAYYEALRKKDYQALWERDEDKSAMAAICFAVEQCRDTSAALVRKLLETRNDLSEDVARYLLEKVLVYSESKREADEAAEEADMLLKDILSRTRFPQSDAVWQNIEICLNIRKTWRTMVKCKTVLNVYQEQKSRFEVFEQDYANNYKEISEEIKTLGNQKIGGEVTSAVKRAKEWFTNRTAELDSLIKRRRNETAIIEEHLQTLQSIRTELENGMESGLQPERCDAICNTLSAMESEADEVVDTGKLDRERKKLLEDYQTHLKTIEAAKDAEVEKEKEHQRIKIHKTADRKRKLPKLVLKILIAVVVIFGLETFNYEVLDMGVFYYLPDIAFNNRIIVINDSLSPYYITWVPKSHIQIDSGIDLSFVIDPFGAEYLSIDPPIKKLKIHEGTERVSLNCEKLKKLTIPDSVTKLELSHLTDELALTLELPEHLESFKIYDSPYLTDTGYQALKIQESMWKIDVENCCNLDMSEVYDNLYSKAIDGAPLLENEVQLKNLLYQKEIPYGAAVTETFDPKFDILSNVKFGEETTPDENTRRVDFSFDMKHRGIIYTFEAYVISSVDERYNDYSSWTVPTLDVVMECTDVDPSELMQQLEAGDKNAILEVLDGQTIPINGIDVILNKDEITVMESEMIEVSEAKYCIPLKLKIDKPLGEITFLGRVWLSEQDGYPPRLILVEMTADIDLLGSYTCLLEDGTESILTIDKRYEKCYSVTMDGEKQMLAMDSEAESKGMFCSMGRNEEKDYYAFDSVKLNAAMDGIEISDRKAYYEGGAGGWAIDRTYYKTGSAVSDTMPEDITPLAGVWQGTYQSDSGVTVNSRRYILPVGENAFAAVSYFGPMEGADDFASGATFDILHFDSQSGSCVIESKEWLEHPEGYHFATFEGNVNDSYDVISGDGEEYPFTITKTEPDNTAGMDADSDGWSIYDASGNVKEELAPGNENIPEDAYTWNYSSYYFFDNCGTWEEAKAYCESLGGHLAIITSEQETAAILSFAERAGYDQPYEVFAFFGASVATEEGEWRWIDGNDLSQTYTNWANKEPKDSYDKWVYICADVSHDGKWWSGVRFDPGELFICEWD